MKKFEEAESPLSEELFASKILLLNGQILCHLEMFNRLGHSKKLFAFISEFVFFFFFYFVYFTKIIL